MRVRIAAAVIAASLAGALLGACGSDDSKPATAARPATPAGPPKVTVHVGSERVRAEVAATDQARLVGLSGRLALAEGQGMLFAFPAPQKPVFWMKGMRFPLDILWIRNRRVSQITSRIPAPPPNTPNARLRLYEPRKPIDAALEVVAGYARRHGIETGDRVSIRRPAGG